MSNGARLVDIMKKSLIALVTGLPLLLNSVSAPAQQGGKKQYIGDRITLAVRREASSSAEYLGTVASGDQVVVLRSLGQESFAQVRTASGVVGWIPARYLSDEPAAADALALARRERDEAKARIDALEQALQTARADLAKAGPALALASENEALKQRVAEREQELQRALARYDSESSRRHTMFTGGALLLAGMFASLLFQWIGRRGKRRRYGDL